MTTKRPLFPWLRQFGFSAARTDFAFWISLFALGLVAGCGAGANAGKVDKAEVDAQQTSEHHHARVNGFRSLDVYADGETIHLLLGQYREGIETPVLKHVRSTDGGLHWFDPVVVDTGAVPPANPHRGVDAQIAAHGPNVVAIWTGPGGSEKGKGAMGMSISADGGRTWRPGESPGDEGSESGSTFIDVTYSEDAFHLVWLDGRSGPRGLRYAGSKDGGRTWSAVSTLDTQTCDCCWNTITGAGNGKLYTLYRDDQPRDMALASSSDGGVTWDLRGHVGNFNWQIDGCPHTGGGLAVTAERGVPLLHSVVWTGREEKVGVYHLASADEGRTWTAPQRLGDDGAKHGDLAVSRSGHLAAVWDAYVNKDYSVFGATSRDGGRTWSEPQNLSRNGKSATHPRVVAVAGKFRVFWTEVQEEEEKISIWKMASLPADSGQPVLEEVQGLP